jgi:hypothetical protein
VPRFHPQAQSDVIDEWVSDTALVWSLGAAVLDEDPEIAWRVDALRAHLPADGSVPRELTILGLPPAAGRCPSCGDLQPYGQTGKCTLCCLASVAVLRGLSVLPAGDGP